jgi:lambda repressor-like predicted transcriptional regulator
MSELNVVQTILAQLEEKGWTLVAIADSEELKVHRNTVGEWKAGTKYPKLDAPVIDALNRLLKKNRIPKKKRRSY